MRAIRKLARLLGILVAVALVAALGLIGYLTVNEYRPQDIEAVQLNLAARQDVPVLGSRYTLVSWNLGYACLGRDQDFFMDGGTMVRPDQKQTVEENLSGILGVLSAQKADLYLLQEVDQNSHRSYSINQVQTLRHGLSLTSAFALNYKCDFVPFPWPMIGKVESGLMTLSGLKVAEATRESLPTPFSWPVRVVNLKRCLLVERIPISDSEHELVLINLHLEAFDDGEGKKAQTRQLMEILKTEQRNGNYVIAGGDFNQSFPGVTEIYSQLSENYWQAGQLSESDLPEGYAYAFDASVPTNRAVRESYSGDRKNSQFYVIDGFILSSNIKINHLETVDLNFEYSDHQPVRLEFTLI
ncbi:MAG: endonuclease [Candidatus Limiplasma sp.]|nr:endonuclease [Candidatus Limiplasma sp.]